MSEKQKRLEALRNQLTIISDYMNKLTEISKKYLPETEKMKEICVAQQKNVKKALEILNELSELEKTK